MRDLAPDVYRQRMIIEGTLSDAPHPRLMKRILSGLCDTLNMVALTKPVVNNCEEYGWCAYMHWKTSGVHMYVWEHRDPCFFSIDIYTCKEFKPEDAENYVKEFFGECLIDIECGYATNT